MTKKKTPGTPGTVKKTTPQKADIITINAEEQDLKAIIEESYDHIQVAIAGLNLAVDKARRDQIGFSRFANARAELSDTAKSLVVYIK